jgi:N-acetyl-1-D-myo-inositol-2-amino-2-deoxy-alpha-D-glucopyranoside deacetylase
MPGLLALHAHPDDESITMGGTLAALADRGVPVTVVTATRGEVGEIHNRDDADQVRDRLGEIREAELTTALSILGVGEPVFLGYRDSGMMGTGDNSHAGAFWAADFTEAVGRLVRIIRDRRPAVITAYDPFGGYGHPDHIQVHRVGTAAYWAAADVGRYPAGEFGEPWWPSKLYWATWSREGMVKVRREMSGDLGAEDVEEPAAGSLTPLITTTVDVGEVFERKHAALLAHDTQFSADSWVRTIPPDKMRGFLGREAFTLVHTAVDVDPAEPDLVAGT